MDDTFHISRRQYEYDDNNYTGATVYDMKITEGKTQHNLRFMIPETEWVLYCNQSVKEGCD